MFFNLYVFALTSKCWTECSSLSSSNANSHCIAMLTQCTRFGTSCRWMEKCARFFGRQFSIGHRSVHAIAKGICKSQSIGSMRLATWPTNFSLYFFSVHRFHFVRLLFRHDSSKHIHYNWMKTENSILFRMWMCEDSSPCAFFASLFEVW